MNKIFHEILINSLQSRKGHIRSWRSKVICTKFEGFYNKRNNKIDFVNFFSQIIPGFYYKIYLEPKINFLKIKSIEGFHSN